MRKTGNFILFFLLMALCLPLSGIGKPASPPPAKLSPKALTLCEKKSKTVTFKNPVKNLSVISNSHPKTVKIKISSKKDSLTLTAGKSTGQSTITIAGEVEKNGKYAPFTRELIVTIKKCKKPKHKKPKSKQYGFKLSFHVPDNMTTTVSGVSGQVKLTNTVPQVARAQGSGKENYKLLITATGVGKTTITIAGKLLKKNGKIRSFKIKYAVTVKALTGKPNKPEKFPTISTTLPIGNSLTALFLNLNAKPPQQIVKSVQVSNSNPKVVTAGFNPATNTLTINGIAPGFAVVKVEGKSLKYAQTNSTPPPGGAAVPSLVGGTTKSTTVLTGNGTILTLKLVQVKTQYAAPKYFKETFNITVVTCPSPADTQHSTLLVPGGVSLLFQGVDVNQVLVVADNASNQEQTLIIPAGLVFVPDDPSYQKMMVVHTARLVLSAGDPEQMEVRAMCLEMMKEEPNALVKFTPHEQTDPVLQKLADLTSKAGFAGPHDQARIWIYTDHADLDTINKRVLPPLSPGEYLQALYEVSQKAGVDLTAPPYRKLLDPQLLDASDASPEAKEWLKDTLNTMTKK